MKQISRQSKLRQLKDSKEVLTLEMSLTILIKRYTSSNLWLKKLKKGLLKGKKLFKSNRCLCPLSSGQVLLMTTVLKVNLMITVHIKYNKVTKEMKMDNTIKIDRQIKNNQKITKEIIWVKDIKDKSTLRQDQSAMKALLVDTLTYKLVLHKDRTAGQTINFLHLKQDNRLKVLRIKNRCILKISFKAIKETLSLSETTVKKNRKM